MFSPNHRCIPLTITNNIRSAIYQRCILKIDWMSFSQGFSKAFEFFQILCSGGVEDLLGIITPCIVSPREHLEMIGMLKPPEKAVEMTRVDLIVKPLSMKEISLVYMLILGSC